MARGNPNWVKKTDEEKSIEELVEETKDLPAISPEELAKIRAEAFEDARRAMQEEADQKATEAAAKAKAEGEKRFPVRIKRDYWAKDDVADQWPRSEDGNVIDNRIVAGTRISLPISEARRLINAGVAERADDIPDV
jgi:hypothetical protein